MQILFTESSMIFILIGIFSMLTHGVKKWTQGEIRGNLIDWYVVHPRASIGALMACLGGVVTLILTGVVSDYSIGSHVMAVWGVGFAADTMNNQNVKTK